MMITKIYVNYIIKLYNVQKCKQTKQKLCNFNTKNLYKTFIKNKNQTVKNTVYRNNQYTL